jgi:hypothetical protein
MRPSPNSGARRFRLCRPSRRGSETLSKAPWIHRFATAQLPSSVIFSNDRGIHLVRRDRFHDHPNITVVLQAGPYRVEDKRPVQGKRDVSWKIAGSERRSDPELQGAGTRPQGSATAVSQVAEVGDGLAPLCSALHKRAYVEDLFM